MSNLLLKPCVVSMSQVDLFSDKAIELSSAPTIYPVFVGAYVNESPTNATGPVFEPSTDQINPPTKLIFDNPTVTLLSNLIFDHPMSKKSMLLNLLLMKTRKLKKLKTKIT